MTNQYVYKHKGKEIISVNHQGRLFVDMDRRTILLVNSVMGKLCLK